MLAITAFAAAQRPARGGLFSQESAAGAKPGIYLDGGFGVGKTHLLAALWHAAPGRKYFGTFIEYTARWSGRSATETTVKLLTGAALSASTSSSSMTRATPGDDPLARPNSWRRARGMAATSNTPPNALGEGRFAAQDFLREIDAHVRPVHAPSASTASTTVTASVEDTLSPTTEDSFAAAVPPSTARSPLTASTTCSSTCPPCIRPAM